MIGLDRHIRQNAKAHAGGASLERWVALHGRITQSFGRAAALNLEPRQVVLSTARDLSRMARGGVW